MNPFEEIDPKQGLLDDRKSEFYGRFRLNFNQVYPFREHSYGRVFIKIKEQDIQEAVHVHSTFPEHLQLRIDLFHQQSIRNDKYIQIDCFDDKDWFLCLAMLSDVIFIPMYNYFFALQMLAPYLEDCHFFIYSSGDADTRWLDEYKIENKEVYFQRNTIETEAYWGIIIYYLKEAVKNNDTRFTRFAAYQLYIKLFGYESQSKKEYKKRFDFMSKSISGEEKQALENCLKRLFNCNFDMDLKGRLDKIFNFSELNNIDSNISLS